MLRFMIPVVLSLAAGASAFRVGSSVPSSAASEAQIRFAIENKYDDTGPGAKQPEYAYNTYKTLDEALVAYLDDPDTKLPDHERTRAIQKLVNPINYHQRPQVQRFLPKTVEEYTGFNKPMQEQEDIGFRPNEAVFYRPKPELKPLVINRYRLSDKLPEKTIYHVPNIRLGDIENDINVAKRSQHVPFKFHKLQSSRGGPLSIAHYTREPELEAHDQFDPNPKYTFSYGVHDKNTGDSKSAHETRDGGTVQGYYTFMDPDGKQRIVHYTADDKLGFRATVERADTHT